MSRLEANDVTKTVLHIPNRAANVLNTHSWPTDKDVLSIGWLGGASSSVRHETCWTDMRDGGDCVRVVC
jgi:hypothetical protein